MPDDKEPLAVGQRVRFTRGAADVAPGTQATVVGFYRREKPSILVRLDSGAVREVDPDLLDPLDSS
jgi:hypothetical protein